MIWTAYTFDWQGISKRTDDFTIWLTLVNWRKLNTRDEQILLQWTHGATSSPTLADARVIEIEWIIEADTRFGTSQAMDYLDKLFSLQARGFETEYKTFTVTDEQEREWEIKAKIKQAIDYELDEDDWQDGSDRRFRVVLQWDDPRYFSTVENTFEATGGIFGGVKLGAKMGFALNDFANEITIIGTGNIATPCRFSIQINGNISKPFKILNLDTWRYLAIDESFTNGDVLDIDTKLYTIMKNGASIKSKRISWSSWLLIDGITRFWFYDIDGTINADDFVVDVYFSNVLL